jgi:hypothetical protein
VNEPMTTSKALKLLFRKAVVEGRAGLIPKDSDLELTTDPILYRDEWWWVVGKWIISWSDMTNLWISWPRYAIRELHPELVDRLGL